MFCHSGNEGRHAGDAGHHLVHYIVEITAVVEIQRGIERHLVSIENQLDLKQGGDALGSVRVVHEVLQGAAYCAAEACQDHAVHIVGVGLPLAAVQVCDTEQRLVLLQHGKSDKLAGRKNASGDKNTTCELW